MDSRLGRPAASIARTGHAGVEPSNPSVGVAGEGLEALRQEFRERFGRDPEPDDPVLFDPTAGEPIPLDNEAEALITAMSDMAMRRAGIDAKLIYASHKTGLKAEPSSGPPQASLMTPTGTNWSQTNRPTSVADLL